MKKKIKQKDQFVLIYWKDAAMHGAEQVTRKQAEKDWHLIKAISGGILVHEDKEQITIALDWFHQHDEFRNLASYPKSGMYKVIKYKFTHKK